MADVPTTPEVSVITRCSCTADRCTDHGEHIPCSVCRDLIETENARAYFFGVTNGHAGHFLVSADGGPIPSPVEERLTMPWGRQATNVHGRTVHIDGSLAPRDDRGEEMPQGVFAIRHLPNGYTSMAWWDRTQGDRRGACNSVLLVEGRRSAEEMRAALAEHFPKVLANLTAAGVELVPVAICERIEAAIDSIGPVPGIAALFIGGSIFVALGGLL